MTSEVRTDHEPDTGELMRELRGPQEPRPFKKAAVAHLSGDFKPGGMELGRYVRAKDVLED